MKILQTKQSNEYQVRLQKLNKIKKYGFSFPNQFKPNINAEKIQKRYSLFSREQLQKLFINIRIPGRILQKRIIGKATFILLQNEFNNIQIYIKKNNFLSSEKYKQLIKNLDLGDIVGVEGQLFKTKTEELTINCKKIELLTKSLFPLPDKYHGLSEQETRYRKRYLELITNKNTKNIFIMRSNIIKIIRNFMNKQKFLEVETPMIQNIPGGAIARPFITHHNTLNTDMYLRISPELYLKQLIIGGFNKIFEINKNFRNEGISTRHNPEFTMMEAYMTYTNYKDMMILIQKLMQYIVKKIFGKTKIKYKNIEFDFSKPYEKLTMKESILRYIPNTNKSDLNYLDKTLKIARTLNIPYKSEWGIGKIINEIFEKTVEKKLIQPTFITEYPIEVSPLSRRNDRNIDIADRFEFYLSGYEMANGFSELNDPEDQRQRFIEQSKLKKLGHSDAMFYDSNYITALEHGLPPTSGVGIGIDRLIMILSNQDSIRDVIFFPTMRTKE